MFQSAESAFRQQQRAAGRPVEQLANDLAARAGKEFAESVVEAARRGSMAVRLTDHVLDLIDWSDPADDPIRRQFLGLVDELEDDHPLARQDALAERDDSPADGLVVRHPDRALLVALDVCPVYCRYCTRSYSVGPDTETLQDKVSMPIAPRRWEHALDWVEAHDEVREVIISGGDIWMLAPRHLVTLGVRLATIKHIRRVRLSTRGLTAAPGRLAGAGPWREAFETFAATAAANGQRVAVHTHFNCVEEVSDAAIDALRFLEHHRVVVRNHSVLLKGVNDSSERVVDLVRALSDEGVVPYYLFVADMVPGSEHLRTSVAEAAALEGDIVGRVAGYDVPRVVVDLPGGGGKRPIHSFESYDRASGVSGWSAPAVKAGTFVVADPLRYLTRENRDAWLTSRDAPALAKSIVERGRP